MNQELPKNLNTNKSWLYRLATELPLSSEALEHGLERLGAIPHQQDWKNWLTVISLGLGAALFLSGVVFFFAFNWENLHRFSRFGVIGLGIMVTAFAAYKVGIEKLAGKLLLTASSVLTGVLLAVFGMVYQTGADSYQLFASWALLIFPWVLASRFQPLWLIWVIITNIAAIRWIGISNVGRFNGFETFRTFMYIPVLINAAILLVRESTKYIHGPLETGRWFPGIVAWALLSSLTWIPLEGIFDNTLGPMWSGLFLMYLVTLGSMIYYYYKVRHDLFMLVLTMVSIIVVLTAGFIKILAEGDFNLGSLLLIGVFIISETTVATKLILSISRTWKAEEKEND